MQGQADSPRAPHNYIMRVMVTDTYHTEAIADRRLKQTFMLFSALAYIAKFL